MRTNLSRRRGRALAAFTAAIVTSTVLAGCGSGGPDEAGGGGEGTLDVWVYQDASTKVQEELVKRFNKQSDVKVKLTQVAGDSYQDKMRTAMGTPNAPDVFFNWGGGSIANFVEKDMLVDLTPEFEKDAELKKAFIPSVVDSGRVNDKIYGVPMRGMQPVLLFMNTDVFEKAGAEKPESWEDLLALVDTFKKEGVTPFALAGADGWPELMWVEYLLDRFGGAEVFKRIQDGDSSGWEDPAVMKTAETVEDLVDRGAFGKNFASVNYTEDGASTLFAKGKAAMHLMGSWEYSNQQANQPEFAKEALDYTTFPAVPGGKGDIKNVVGNPTNYWSINKKAEEQEAALEFVKFAAEDQYIEDLVANGDVPTTSDAESRLDKHANPEYAKFQYNLVKEAPDFTLSWDQALSAQQAEPTLTNIQKLFNGQLTAQQFVDAMKGL
ncbi:MULTISPECIES: ABC transporter substrate-binding protein [Streptomyces]|uniref:Extracellular solute-binding protein n=1 Tax=Streptomyces lycii TaxID=2654337 RepID=A0ABQ7FN07_9ACTN|nr:MULTISPECIES: extracellular solute-binding protein [Streptomyces]KAF4410220.1 extracellular solute-binding protein [Streptomyces lycii]PGH50487.1 sugar-binding protein [Streptomyces sp. Ru87]